MSRIRSIHPGVWTDERFVSVTAYARLLFMGIWNECDDFGSFEWSPLKLKMRLLHADPVDAADLLAELEGAGVVMRYEIAGKTYGAVRNFCQYQRPKKPNDQYPQTDEVRHFVNTEARSTRDGSEPVGNQFGTGGEKCRQMEDGGGNRGKEVKSRSQRKTSNTETAPRGALPYAFEGKVIRLTQRDFDQWRQSYPDLDLPALLQSRDDWLVTDADEATRKKWFVSTSTHFGNLQQKATANRREAETYDRDRITV